MLEILTIALCQSYATIPVILLPYLTLLPWKKKIYMFVVLHWFERNGLRNFTSTSKKIGKRLGLETEKLWPIVKG